MVMKRYISAKVKEVIPNEDYCTKHKSFYPKDTECPFCERAENAERRKNHSSTEELGNGH